MKSIILVLVLVCATFVAAQPDITGTDFLIDNILKPLLQDIQQNSLTFLQQLLQGMIPGVGKRSIGASEVQMVLEAFKQHLANNNAEVTGVFSGILSSVKAPKSCSCVCDCSSESSSGSWVGKH